MIRAPLNSWASTMLVAALATAVGGLAGSCGGDDPATDTAGPGAAGPGPASSSASTGGGGGEGATGGMGGMGGMGGDPGCMSDADCVGHPDGELCDIDTGLCHECLPASDDCPTGQYCNESFVCEVGCNDDTDCTADTQCNTMTHKCVGCVEDVDCQPGSICIADTCIPGCSGTQPCEPGASCCVSTCFDLAVDELHCGDCNTVCTPPPHALPICNSGVCEMGPCDSGWADCNQDAMDGCEQNILQDGDCLCNPGDLKPCYTGAPGTQDVGLCKGGFQECVDGIAWGPCQGQILPAAEDCNQIDDDCDGSIEPQPCEDCEPDTGTCMGQVGKWCKDDGLGYVFETCDPTYQGTTCNPNTGKCDGACGLAQLGASNVGCDYYPTVTANLVTPNRDPAQPNVTVLHFSVAVSNTTPNAATITVTKGAATVTTVTVAANSVQIIHLGWDPNDLILKGASTDFVVPFPASVRVDDGSYRLRSNQPVTLYQFSPLEYTYQPTAGPAVFSYSNDASILLPVNAWTGKYRIAARHHFAGGSGFFAITAKDDNTTVNVTAGPQSGQIKAGVAGIGANGTGSVVLNSGDVIELVTNGGTSTSDPNDPTGTLVQADKPVQVIAGHSCVYIPFNVGYCDHIEESMFPVETLSDSYIVTSPLIAVASPKVEMVRIVSTEDNTTLTYEPAQPGAPASIATAGGWAEIANNVGDFRISASAPILVVQYMEGQDAGGNSGDPAMTVGVPTDQFRDKYLFHAPVNYETSFVNVTAPNNTAVTLDGQPVVGFAQIGNTGYSVAKVQVPDGINGNHTITSSKPFGIAVYGYGQYTSYWYPGGSNLVKLHE